MRERDLFDAALAIADPAQRSAYLAKVSAGNPELRQHIEGLLAMHAQLGSFLEVPAPALAATVDDPVREPPGTMIGPYKLLEQIGEGGMGLVYVAEQQQPVRRRVALKVIKPGMDSRQVIARFEAERQALAMMDHPHIAKVHDGGTTPDGRPYFVMELVKGTPITDYCDQQRLTTRQRLGLFADVCQAVQHAHQKGIIHRDLKPSNILVAVHDVKPVVKVIDFGIAKATGGQLTDKTLYTQLAQMVGTPLYMSPEQAGASSLDVDTRSDVYSLGVLLYELLTGTTPFGSEALKQAGYDEMRRIIREEEPPKPSTRISTMQQAALSTIAERRGIEPRRLGEQVRGELDWVVMKALEKDRDQRYESASALAADVQRYLADEPLQASPPSAVYRLKKLARRHKVALAVAGLVVVAVLAVAISTGYVLRDRSTRQAVVAARVTDALDESETLYRAGKIPEALNAARRAEGLLDTGPADQALKARVRERIEDFEMVLKLDDAVFKTESGVGSGRAAEYERLFRLNGIDLSVQSAEEAAARIRSRFIAEYLAFALDQWNVGEALNRKKFAVTRLVDPDPLRDKVRQACERQDPAAVEEVARTAPVDELPPATLRLIGCCLIYQTRNSEARQELARKFLRRAQRKYPSDVWLNHFLADALTFEPKPQFVEAAGYFRILVALRPSNRQAYAKVAQVLALGDRWEEAISYARMAMALDPDDAGIRVAGRAFAGMGRLDEATAVYKEALRLKPDSAAAHNSLAWLLATCPDPKLRDIPRAVALAKRAVELAPDDANYWNTLGAVHYRAGDWKAAVEALKKSEDLSPGRYLPVNAVFLAMAHWQLGEKEKARDWYAQSVSWMDKHGPTGEELKRFRAETEELLGIPKSQPAKEKSATKP